MTIQNRFGSRNPLLRHVRRHANTTTLFRTPSADDPLPPSGVVFPAWAVPTAVSNPPLPDVVDSAVAYAERSAGLGSPGQPSILGQPSAVPPAAAQPAAPTVMPTVQRTAVPQPAQFVPAPPAAASPTAAPLSTPQPVKEDDWPEWRRLESIVQRHKARQSVDTAAPEPPTAVSPAPSDTLARAVAAAESGQPAAAPPGRLPLEAVWPVRREPAPPTAVPATSPQPEPSVFTGPILPEQDEALVRAKLEDVHAGRASDSSIELHLPRRPRPGTPSSRPSPAADLPTAQRSAAAAPANEPAAASAPLVETPIGPLPADMWEILGETPPSTALMSPPSTPTDSLQRAIAAAETAEPIEKVGTAVPQTESSPLQPAGQRAIAAETAEPVEKTATAVSQTESLPLQPAVQRAIAAAETGEPVEKTATAVPQTESSPLQPAVQRAIAAAESPPVRDTPTPPPIIRMASGAHRVPGSPGGGVPEVVDRMDTRPLALEPASQASPAADKVEKTAVAVQRAIAAAETAPGRSDISFRARVVQPDPTAPLRRMESTAWPLSRTEIPMARVVAAPASLHPTMPADRQPHAPAFQTPGGWSPALVQRAVARAEAPLADASLANAPLADAPLADVPLANAPLADAPLANAPLADARLASSPLTEFLAGAWTQPAAPTGYTAVAVKSPASQPGTSATATAVQRAVVKAETAVAPLSEWPGVRQDLPHAEAVSAGQRQEAIKPLTVGVERETAVSRQPATSEVSPSSLKTAPPTPATRVQRALGGAVEQNTGEADLAESVSDSSGMAPSATQELDQEEEELDVNELARQVYDKLRRRLTIDRERERGRY